MFRPEDDPQFKAVIRRYEKAVSGHKMALIELRRYYLNTVTINRTREAILQEIAHESERVAAEAAASISKSAWELVPFTHDAEHISQIEKIKSEVKQRIEAPIKKYISQRIVVHINPRFIDFNFPKWHKP